MRLKPLDLVPYGIELLKIVFEHFILRGLDRQLVPRYGNLINLKVFLFPNQHFIHKIFHHVSKHVYDNLVQTCKRLQLDNVRGVGLDKRGNRFETFLDNVEKHVRCLVDVRADDGNVEQLLLIF